MSKKGMCLDDKTFTECSGRMTAKWPNTDSPVQVMRIFKPCVPSSFGGNCDEKRREADWQNLVKFVQTNNIMVLMGNEVSSCDPEADQEQWRLTLDLLQRLGKDHIFGVAIGNELDLHPDPCMSDFWKSGYLDLLKRRAADLDKIGFHDTKISAVVTTGVIAELPFVNTADQAIGEFFKGAYHAFGKQRWAWSFNVYPFWNPGHCSDYDLDASKRFSELKGILSVMRQSITNITNNTDDTFWLTETGWSSFGPKGGRMDLCPGKAYSSLPSAQSYYEQFLKWDLTLEKEVLPPDLVLYFTMRDLNGEYFGLMGTCEDTNCKIQNPQNKAAVISSATSTLNLSHVFI